MADRGIIFSAPMVRALLDGRKAQTRRLCKPANAAALSYAVAMGDGWFGDEEGEVQFNTHFAPGDRLYVREAWSHTGQGVWDIAAARRTGRDGVIYGADGKVPGAKYWPSIHLPREFSRLTLLVTDVRVQRVAEISEDDAVAEGLEWIVPGMWSVAPNLPIIGDDPRKVFSDLWNSLHTKPGETWADNPWVVAVSFEMKHGNIDRSEG